MINEIKVIVQNYLNNAKLCNIISGIVVADGVKVSDKLIVPDELISGNLKEYASIGDKVKLIRNQGGQEFYIVEIIDKEFIVRGSTVILSMGGNTYQYKVEDVIK